MQELAGIIILGIFAQWLAWRIKIPAILPLILIGVMVGPISTLFTEDGCKLINPMILQQESGCTNFLFPGDNLFYFVSLAIGIILFEGGLTLKRNEVKGVAPAIIKLITVGSIVTLVGGGLATHYIMGLSWSISFLFAALIIVTGPTVIAPILQNVPLKRNISTVLKWEGILIDPVGALVAVLVYEFIRSGSGVGGFTLHALQSFFTILLIGFALGLIGAYVLAEFIKRKWVAHYLLNVFSLAMVLGVFVFADQLAHESGLLAVVIMGLVLANRDIPQLKEILSFKESLSILLISILFILLAANINMDDLRLLLDWRCGLVFALVIFVLRPLGVFLSTHNSELALNEKVYISWVGPKGIVAAGIASLFGLKLLQEGVPGAEYITPLVFMIVAGTVLLNATTARPIAKLLNVIQEGSNGILIVGANPAARLIGKYLHDNGRHVAMIDSNSSNIKKARELDLEASETNIYAEDLGDHIELVDVGYLLAMTSSPEVNEFAVDRFRDIFGEEGTYRFMTSEERKMDIKDLPEVSFISPDDDYINFLEVVRDHPQIHEHPLSSVSHFKRLVRKMRDNKSTIPVFIKRGENNWLEVIPASYEQLEIRAGDQLVYIGAQLDLPANGKGLAKGEEE